MCFKHCFFADKSLFKSHFVFDREKHVSFLKSVANRFAVIKKELVNEIDRNCDLERGGEERLMRSKYSKEERIERARQFIQKNTYMRVQEYASLTGLAYSTAARELCSIASDPTSGIKSEGAKSGKLYLLAKEQ